MMIELAGIAVRAFLYYALIRHIARSVCREELEAEAQSYDSAILIRGGKVVGIRVPTSTLSLPSAKEILRVADQIGAQ